ncbi:hypothetical protein [Psychrobacillus sp. NPDC093200]|uniref:hypothetical protein n=1 Tax=Psychrobacillus sp. NPDC093200 TaxID=3390656 RepID=UPI003D010065
MIVVIDPPIVVNRLGIVVKLSREKESEMDCSKPACNCRKVEFDCSKGAPDCRQTVSREGIGIGNEALIQPHSVNT